MSTRPEDLRIGDAERDAAVAALGEHFALGRLDREEYDDRSERVWSARTARDLRPVFADLPAPHGSEQTHDATARSEARRRGPVGAGPLGRHGTRAPWMRVPVLPVLVLLVALVMVLPGPSWPLFILGWLWVAGAFRHRRRHRYQWQRSAHW